MRKEKSIKNFITSIIPYVILLLLGFLRVSVFIKFLGDKKCAQNSLFYQIFIYLSLAEAGAGAYILQLYYKCFANDDKKEIVNIYNSAKDLLKKIAFIILGIGILVSFFLKIFTNNSLSLYYMQFVFLLFLFKNAIDYLMMAPKSVIEADQKAYKANIRFYSMKIFEYIVDIVLIYLGFDYIVILLVEILTRFLTYFVTNQKVFKEYPWLKDKPTKKVDLKGVYNLFWHRISEAIHFNTDIIITSSFLSPLLVTIYSSYNYITKYLTDIIDMVVTSISPSFGNSLYKDEKSNMMKLFEEMNISFLFMASFISIMIYVLGNSFVSKVWLGEKYLIGNIAFIFLVINFYIVIARKSVYIFRNSKGLFKETKVIVLIEAIINLVLSLILVLKYGLVGILIATTVSMITTTLWYMPYYIYKKVLNVSCKNYFIKFILVTILTFIVSYGMSKLKFIEVINLLSWILSAVVYGIITFIILFTIFYIFSKDFKDVVYKFKMLVFRKQKEAK